MSKASSQQKRNSVNSAYSKKGRKQMNTFLSYQYPTHFRKPYIYFSISSNASTFQ